MVGTQTLTQTSGTQSETQVSGTQTQILMCGIQTQAELSGTQSETQMYNTLYQTQTQTGEHCLWMRRGDPATGSLQMALNVWRNLTAYHTTGWIKLGRTHQVISLFEECQMVDGVSSYVCSWACTVEQKVLLESKEGLCNLRLAWLSFPEPSVKTGPGVWPAQHTQHPNKIPDQISTGMSFAAKASENAQWRKVKPMQPNVSMQYASDQVRNVRIHFLRPDKIWGQISTGMGLCNLALCSLQLDTISTFLSRRT